jgi:hypothetical protein
VLHSRDAFYFQLPVAFQAAPQRSSNFREFHRRVGTQLQRTAESAPLLVLLISQVRCGIDSIS